MPRERKDFKRKSGLRDATLYVIATEGEKTEKVYFETLVSKDHFFSTRVHIELIPTKNGNSSPRDVIARLDAFRQEYKLRKGDELWIIIDRDHKAWKIQQLSEVQRLCKQKKYSFGLTNPAFELWLILHISDVNKYENTILEKIKENKKSASRTYCEKILVDQIGVFNKSKPDLSKIIPNVKLAISRNKKLTHENSLDLFSNIGSNLNLLIEKLI